MPMLILTSALVLITGYYAWVTNRILGANERTAKTAALSAAISSLTLDMEREYQAVSSKYSRSPEEMGRENVTSRYFEAKDERDRLLGQLRDLHQLPPGPTQ